MTKFETEDERNLVTTTPEEPSRLTDQTQVLYDRIMASQNDHTTRDKLLEEHLASLSTSERTRFESWFQNLNSLVYPHATGYPKPYAWIIYTTDDLERAEELVAAVLDSAADLRQYFISKSMPSLQMSEETFRESLSEYFATHKIDCPERILQIFVTHRNEPSFGFSLSDEAQGIGQQVHALWKGVDRFRYLLLRAHFLHVS